MGDEAGGAVLQTTPEGKPGEESATSGAVLPVDTKVSGTKPQQGGVRPAMDTGGNNTRPNNAPTAEALPGDTGNDAVGAGYNEQGSRGSNDGNTGQWGGTDRHLDTERLQVRPVKPSDKKGVKSTTEVGIGAKSKYPVMQPAIQLFTCHHSILWESKPIGQER